MREDSTTPAPFASPALAIQEAWSKRKDGFTSCYLTTGPINQEAMQDRGQNGWL